MFSFMFFTSASLLVVSLHINVIPECLLRNRMKFGVRPTAIKAVCKISFNANIS